VIASPRTGRRRQALVHRHLGCIVRGDGCVRGGCEASENGETAPDSGAVHSRPSSTTCAPDGRPGLTPPYSSGRRGRRVRVGVEDPGTRARCAPERRCWRVVSARAIVAATALSLAEHGELSLDQNISAYIGNEPGSRGCRTPMPLPFESCLPTAAASRTTPRILSHQGLVGSSDAPTVARRPRRLRSRQAPAFPAGQGFYYSDTNYIIAGLVMEKVTGLRFYSWPRTESWIRSN